MTTPTVDRREALVRRIDRIAGRSGALDAVALGLVDAVLAGESDTLGAALDALRVARAQADHDPELAGRIDALISVVYSGLERMPSTAAVAGGTQAHAFLSALAESSSQLGSSELRRLLDTDDTQVSRTGHRLLEAGLVMRRKLGRRVFWLLTPRGRRALDGAPGRPRPANVDFWQEALRRGFEVASGDQPVSRREVDPTRERILESALGLHETQGIRATTWPQIADRAGLPVETVEEMFPTLDELVRSCGAHVFEDLQMPPHDRAADVFAGAKSVNERVHRMTQTFFGAYERGAEGVTAARRERKDVPALDDAMIALDSSLDAVVREALRPERRDDAGSVTSIRALTDVEVWRALRDQGASANEAVDQASTAVERWLEAHPALN